VLEDELEELLELDELELLELEELLELDELELLELEELLELDELELLVPQELITPPLPLWLSQVVRPIQLWPFS